MSHVVLNEMGETEGPEYRVGDLFRVGDDVCILLRLGGDNKDYYMVPVLGKHRAFDDSYELLMENLESLIASGSVVRLPKGSSITITQE